MNRESLRAAIAMIVFRLMLGVVSSLFLYIACEDLYLSAAWFFGLRALAPDVTVTYDEETDKTAE